MVLGKNSGESPGVFLTTPVVTVVVAAVVATPKMHCTKSHRPFELFVNENCKLWNEAEMNVTFERGSAQDPLAQSSLC